MILHLPSLPMLRFVYARERKIYVHTHTHKAIFIVCCSSFLVKSNRPAILSSCVPYNVVVCVGTSHSVCYISTKHSLMTLCMLLRQKWCAWQIVWISYSLTTHNLITMHISHKTRSLLFQNNIQFCVLREWSLSFLFKKRVYKCNAMRRQAYIYKTKSFSILFITYND